MPDNTNTVIEAGNLPSYAIYDKTKLDEVLLEQTGYDEIPVKDLHTPIGTDPTNWMIFDAGLTAGTDYGTTPQWMGWGTTNINPVALSPYAAFPQQVWYNAPSSNPEFNNGPRNLPYLNVSQRTFVKINRGITNGSLTTPTMLTNDAWKNSGALEFTIKPNKANCTLISGAFAVVSQIGTYSVYNGSNFSASSSDRQTQLIELPIASNVGVGEEYAMFNGFSLFQNSNGTVQFLTPDVKAGLSLTSNNTDIKRFKIDIINGKVAIIFETLFGPNPELIKIVGTTNVNDGNWHHVVINRPSSFTKKEGDLRYGGTGCIEIWVDGQLEVRSYEIDENTLLPSPHILFNDIWNPGIRNGVALTDPSNTYNNPKTITTQWILEEIEKTGYSGGIRDYVFRQYYALRPHDIKLNYIYAMQNIESTQIRKAETAKATANIVQPTVSVNKKTVLKLYWNNLLNDKNKALDGLELDETFNVHSYSVTHKNIINPTQTFNLDLNENITRKYLQNVRAVCQNFVFIFMPNSVMAASDELPRNGFENGFVGQPEQLNLYDNEKILLEGVGGQWFLNNLLFGGVNLAIGERILLTGQHNPNENGVWIYNGGDKPLTRPTDINASDLTYAHVYVTDGKYADTTWVQINPVTHIRKSAQKWIKIDNEASLSTLNSYPIHTTPWTDSQGVQRFIDVNNDIDIDYDIICFMNYPTESSEILNSFATLNDSKIRDAYNIFLQSIRTAVNNGKSLFVSSPMLAVDMGIADKFVYVDQMLEEGDAQSAAISPFEGTDIAANYFDTHRNNKYHLITPITGLTNKATYIMTDFVTYSPNKTNSDYHIKYLNRPNGLQADDEFFIPGLTMLPETLNEQLPGYTLNQKRINKLAAFLPNDINEGVHVTKFANTVYTGPTPISNPYDDYITTIAINSGSGKIFVNCVENSYAFSRSDYNTGRIQNVTVGQNGETNSTVVWQYSTSRLNKKNLYDFSEVTNAIGQTTPTGGGGGAIVQAQSHTSNGLIRKQTNKDDIKYQSDLYPDSIEEFFSTTEIPVYSMTWLGLKWLAGE